MIKRVDERIGICVSVGSMHGALVIGSQRISRDLGYDSVERVMLAPKIRRLL